MRRAYFAGRYTSHTQGLLTMSERTIDSSGLDVVSGRESSVSRVPFGVFEMQRFAEASDDDRVKLMWKRIVDLQNRCARWCDSDVGLRLLLKQIADSPVDLVNDGECCMRVDVQLIRKAKKFGNI